VAELKGTVVQLRKNI